MATKIKTILYYLKSNRSIVQAKVFSKSDLKQYNLNITIGNIIFRFSHCE